MCNNLSHSLFILTISLNLFKFRYMLELKDDQEVEFVNKVIGLAKAAGCQVIQSKTNLKES